MGNESRNGKKDLNHNDSGLTGSNLLTNQEEEQKIYLNSIDHHGRLYWIQDDTDGMCVGPYGMAPCGEANLWGIRSNSYRYRSSVKISSHDNMKSSVAKHSMLQEKKYTENKIIGNEVDFQRSK